MDKKTKTLTAKQAMFVKEYLIDLNATQAAIRAGYSEKTASGSYVYFLIDPRDNRIFYIGKGTGNRFKQHFSEARSGKHGNGVKCAKINDIYDGGSEPEVFIFDGGMTSNDALTLEHSMIKALEGCGLTNISGGTVGPEDSLISKYETLIGRTRSFNSWCAELDNDKRLSDTVSNVWGSREDFYYTFLGWLHLGANPSLEKQSM